MVSSLVEQFPVFHTTPSAASAAFKRWLMKQSLRIKEEKGSPDQLAADASARLVIDHMEKEKVEEIIDGCRVGTMTRDRLGVLPIPLQDMMQAMRAVGRKCFLLAAEEDKAAAQKLELVASLAGGGSSQGTVGSSASALRKKLRHPHDLPIFMVPGMVLQLHLGAAPLQVLPCWLSHQQLVATLGLVNILYNRLWYVEKKIRAEEASSQLPPPLSWLRSCISHGQLSLDRLVLSSPWANWLTRYPLHSQSISHSTLLDVVNEVAGWNEKTGSIAQGGHTSEDLRGGGGGEVDSLEGLQMGALTTMMDHCCGLNHGGAADEKLEDLYHCFRQSVTPLDSCTSPSKSWMCQVSPQSQSKVVGNHQPGGSRGLAPEEGPKPQGLDGDSAEVMSTSESSTGPDDIVSARSVSVDQLGLSSPADQCPGTSLGLTLGGQGTSLSGGLGLLFHQLDPDIAVKKGLLLVGHMPKIDEWAYQLGLPGSSNDMVTGASQELPVLSWDELDDFLFPRQRLQNTAANI